MSPAEFKEWTEAIAPVALLVLFAGVLIARLAKWWRDE